MDAPKAPDGLPALAIAPVQFEIILAEDTNNPLAFVSPPMNDISEMAEIERNCFSLREATSRSGVFEASAQQRLSKLRRKEGEFANSPTYHNRVANLQRALGDLRAEAESLNRASQLDFRSLYRRKIAENLLRTGHARAAKEAFSDLASSDSYSALRVASLFAISGDLDEAEKWVTIAIELEPDGYSERLFQGGVLLLRGQPQQAIRIFWMALSERPTSSIAYANLAYSYLATNNAKKAFSCLKRSVALDPLNRSAILALADVAHVLDRDADAINNVRYFLQFEQRDPAVWSRFARSLLRIGAIDECISALKRQGAFEKSISLWNNLGVAYARNKQRQQSLEAFNYALSIGGSGTSRQELIVARNIAQMISSLGKQELLISVTEPIVQSDIDRSIARDDALCDIYGFYISALMQSKRKQEGLSLAQSLLEDPSLGEPLANWLFQSLSSWYGLNRSSDDVLDRLVSNFLTRQVPARNNVGLLNNAAFALAELGRLDEAEACISQVSHALHKDAYLTATLGLLNFRRGRADRGETLYKEAIGLAVTARDKSRIRQKMFLEIGRHSSEKDAKDAKRALERVLKEKHGEQALTQQARRLLKKLPNH